MRREGCEFQVGGEAHAAPPQWMESSNLETPRLWDLDFASGA